MRESMFVSVRAHECHRLHVRENCGKERRVQNMISSITHGVGGITCVSVCASVCECLSVCVHISDNKRSLYREGLSHDYRDS